VRAGFVPAEPWRGTRALRTAGRPASAKPNS
jgi:hypothetical protein